MDINKAFDILMGFEGGATVTNLKNDKGGETKYGIAKASHPNIDIPSLTEEQAKNIYSAEYWKPCHCEELKPELQYIHFDTAVNCGIGSANKILQRAAKVNDDGLIGPATIGASLSISIQDYAIERANHYKAIVEKDATQQRFLRGWLDRVDTILKMYKSNQL